MPEGPNALSDRVLHRNSNSHFVFVGTVRTYAAGLVFFWGDKMRFVGISFGSRFCHFASCRPLGFLLGTAEQSEHRRGEASITGAALALEIAATAAGNPPVATPQPSQPVRLRLEIQVSTP